ncbi:MAG TPA: M90 family metallopeptidase [Burkholderiaceae bacterium]|nr:M90 family metallopeptidase [Burkholderiaceae bacterium]
MTAWWRTPLARLGDWRERRALARRVIPDELWASTLARCPFVTRLGVDDLAELRRLCSLFLDEKEFHGAGGLEVTDDMAVAVAVQACLPVLRLGLGLYRGFVGIVMHRDEVVAQRSWMDEDGVVHEFDEALTGEAVGGGPMMLTWADVRDAAEGADWGYNVVIHEFAHVIDMADGAADGVPPLADLAARERWIEIVDSAYEAFCELVDSGADTVVDPYGAEAVEEFFAVSVEAFFVASTGFKGEMPEMYALLAEYFRQDPAGG